MTTCVHVSAHMGGTLSSARAKLQEQPPALPVDEPCHRAKHLFHTLAYLHMEAHASLGAYAGNAVALRCVSQTE